MGATDDGRGMSTEAFEALAAAAWREFDGLRLEFIGGRVSVKHMPAEGKDGILAWPRARGAGA